jgi:uncharacterized membrane protein
VWRTSARRKAIALGLAFLTGSWLLYTLLCASPLARHGWLLGLVLHGRRGCAGLGLTQLFSGRGAYIHFGAIIGTIMVGNVFRVIMPGQRKLVGALERAKHRIPPGARRPSCARRTIPI